MNSGQEKVDQKLDKTFEAGFNESLCIEADRITDVPAIQNSNQ